MPTDTTSAFIIAYHKRNNYFFANLQADFKSQTELATWRNDKREVFGNIQKTMLPFLGVSLASIILTVVRFALSKDLAYFFLAICYSLTFAFCMLLYFLFPVYWGERPVVDPLLTIHLIHFFIFTAIAFLSVSMRFFYVQGEFVRRNNRMTNALALVSSLIAVCTLGASFITEKYYLINNCSMVAAAIITTTYGIHLFVIRKDIKNAFKIVVVGLILMMTFVDFGFFLVLIEDNWNIGYEVLQGFPMIVGLTIMNIFTISAFSKREHQALQESMDLKSRVFEAEMAVVQRSLNPHFIFNCLNLIDSFLFANNNKSARKVLFDFSDLLRLVIDKSPNQLIILCDELEMLRLYLDLERSRSEDCFEYNILVDNNLDTGSLLVPPLIIQPIVENAVKHGILNRKFSGGRVDIQVRRKDMELIVIDVVDNGVGLLKTRDIQRHSYQRKGHVGIQLTRKRLEIMSEIFKSATSFEIMDREGEEGTLVRMHLPIIKSTSHGDSIYH
jgi:sensor histidine kinase YesM